MTVSGDVTLWDDEFAPVTSTIGFINAPVLVVADAMLDWMRRIPKRAKAKRLKGGLRDNIRRLEPLTVAASPRVLLVATSTPEWTAIFDCGQRGSDPTSSVAVLTKALKVNGVVVDSVPAWRASMGPAKRFGGRSLTMFGPEPNPILNRIRSVHVVQDGSRWTFEAFGEVQPFEDVEAYSRRRVADRFTAQMLVDYCAALGLRPFDGDFYSGPSVLVTKSDVVRPEYPLMTIEQAQQWIPSRPGEMAAQ